MFMSNQRFFAQEFNDSNLKRLTIFDIDDKIKINKSNMYHKDCNTLNNQILQIKMYYIFYSMNENQKTIFAIIFLREKTKQ